MRYSNTKMKMVMPKVIQSRFELKSISGTKYKRSMPSHEIGKPGNTGSKLPIIPTMQQIKPRLIKSILMC
jgi:hypothetical protein